MNTTTRSPRPSTTRTFSTSSSTSGSHYPQPPPPLPTVRSASSPRTGEIPLPNGRSDDVHSLGYIYSLRVAVLDHHLQHPPTPRIPVSPNGLPTPPPSASSRMTFLSKGPASPDLLPPSPRRKSSFGLSLKSAKSDDVKLPREFLLDFWGALAEEEGARGWKAGVSSFLSMIKKGTKTEAGMNLREIPTLLEVFSSNLPPPGSNAAPPHVHQAHFLDFLYNALPRLPHFNPNGRPQNEKDKDLLFRLRAEVSSFMSGDQPPTPGSIGPTSPLLERAKSHDSKHAANQTTGLGEAVELVGQIWGISREMLDRDVHSLRQSPLEHLYVADLKRSLTSMSSLQPLNPALKSRQLQLSQALTQVLRDFPELAAPGSPSDFGRTSFSPVSPNGLGSEGLFFTPPRKSLVFSKLAAKVGTARGGRQLVERCQEVWGIGNKKDKEIELDGLVKRWGDSIGMHEEQEWGQAIVDLLQDLQYSPNEELPPAVDHLLSNLLSLLTTSISTIFPDPIRGKPPPSLIPLLNTEPLVSVPRTLKALDQSGDELKGAAVGEYVMAVDQMTGGAGLGNPSVSGYTNGSGGKDSVLAGFEKVAEWIEEVVTDVKKLWHQGIGPLNPAAIILSKQLPLFLAELHSLDKPDSGSAGGIFGLYERVGRLLQLWEELCPGQEHGFELDAFFEPHVVAWLKDTEGNETQEWVSRAVGMDSWVPEGANKHSQSVIDLFDFIRGTAKVILQDLPLGEYNRAVYLIDLSKTVSIAVSQYASTVLALFSADMSPKVSTPTLELQNRLGGKAGNWLAKGQQAVKSLEKRKVDGFVIPPVACVKLTNMGAAQISLEDLIYAMEAEETSRIVKPKSSGKPRYVFSITVMRGQNLVGKSKAADGFVVVSESGERLLKTRTVLGAEDPRWEESFEISVEQVKTLELTAFDRNLVGKHDLIGSNTFKLDPRLFNDIQTRDVLLPLNPRGLVLLRITMEGGEKHDVAYHLSTASRALERAERDMIREMVEKMGEYIKSQLSVAKLHEMCRAGKGKKGKIGAGGVDEREVEASLNPLFDYLNENFSTFSVTLTPPTRLRVQLDLWRLINQTLISLLIPPLSDRPILGKQDPPSPQETDLVFKWLQSLKAFFNAKEGEVEHGVPNAKLQAGPYRELVMVGQYLDLPTPALRDRASAAVKSASSRGASSSGLVGGMRGLQVNEGDGSGAGGKEEENERMAEVLLRIARMRPDLGEFVSQQMGILTRGRVERQAGLL